MSYFLGIDTSNYTTSAALVGEDGKVLKNVRILLPVKEGERGLRQSDAVFAHIKNLPDVFASLGTFTPEAVGVSDRPRDCEDSYMPCFLTGVSAAAVCAEQNGVPLYRFSHQRGHIRAALCSSKREDLIGGEFLSFHLSGGTTEVLHIKDGNIQKIGATLDISAGQAIDRAGVMLGLRFPCGAELEKISHPSEIKPKICVSGTDCNLSGLENKVGEMIKCSYPREVIAGYVIEFIKQTVTKMTEGALRRYPALPVIYAGGVASNKAISEYLSGRFDAHFAEPEFSCDNAAGIALLAGDKLRG